MTLRELLFSIPVSYQYPPPWKYQGLLYKGFGLTVMMVALLASIVLQTEWDQVEFESIEGILLFILMPSIIFVVGAFSFFRGRQYQQLVLLGEQLEDERKPVLFLRSFRDDSGPLSETFGNLLTQRLFAGFTSKEERLTSAVAAIGPLVAIGKPGEKLPLPGAQRFHTRDQYWQQVVTYLMQHSRFVIVQGGRSDGIWWELDKAMQMIPPSRLVIYLNMSREEYETFKTDFHDSFLQDIPPFSEVERRSFWANPVFGFLYFSEDGTFQFSEIGAPFLRRMLSRGSALACRFHYGLRPVYRNVGLAWEKPALSTPKLIFFVLFMWIATIILQALLGVLV